MALLSFLPKRFQTDLVYQVVIFTVTFLLYAAVHAVRKTVSTIRKPLEDIGYSSSFFGYLTCAFMMSYSLGMMWTGVLGDRYKPTIVLLIACVSSAAITTLVGLLMPSYNSTSHLVMYIVLWTLNGLLQSCVWPVEVKLVSRWFSADHSGSLFGIWSANSSVGNILGIGLTALAMYIWGSGSAGISFSFVIPSIVLVTVAIATFMLPNTKKDAGLVVDEIVEPELDKEATLEEAVDEPVLPTKPFSLWSAWLYPGVIRYALCYACIKSVNYTMFYWLTGFLDNQGYEKQDSYMVTIMNDVGWIFGGLACGYGTDRMGSRAPIVGLFIFLSIIPTALIYPWLSSVSITAINIGLNGFFSGGAGNVVASAVCADIGKNDDGAKDITGQVAGIIDGVGAFGAALCMLVMGHLSEVDMSAIFYTLTGLLCAAFLLISDLVYRETRDWLKKVRSTATKTKSTVATE